MCSFINDWYIADTSYTVVLKNISYKLKMMIHLISLYVLLINYQVSEKSGTNWGKTTCTSFCVFRFIYFFLTDEKKNGLNIKRTGGDSTSWCSRCFLIFQTLASSISSSHAICNTLVSYNRVIAIILMQDLINLTFYIYKTPVLHQSCSLLCC